MCGIAAIFAYRSTAEPVRREELDAINTRMIPRGPDAGGIWVSEDERIGMASRRLAIVDLSAEGTQPMSNVEGDLRIVFNGEIYNYGELRAQLVARGARFHSRTDTEVLLQLYRIHGPSMVELLRGMFAFAIWDAPRRRLFVARDPYGIKPLYYANDAGTFRVASTVKALLAGGGVSRTRDAAGEAGFFLFGSVPEPLTIHESIRAVEAGTWFTVTAGGPGEPQRFYSIADVYKLAAEQPTIADLTTPEILLRENVRDSVAHHLVADVPVGIFLSAGIDSMTLTSFADELQKTALQTVTVVFDALRGTSFDESDEAAVFATALGAHHATRVVTREEFLADLPKIFDAMDQPTIDGVNTWFVSKAAAEQSLKVAISGVGGDELFGSYPSFQSVPRMVRTARAAARIPGGRRALAAVLRAIEKSGRGSPKMREVPFRGTSFGGAYFLRRGLFMPGELPGVLPPDRAAEGLAGLLLDETLERAMTPDPATDYGRVASLEASLYMRNQLLRDTDWASMAHSVEVRTPLVDAILLRRIAPLLVSEGARCKDYFAASPGRPLPDAVTRRPKTGFVTPIAQWLDLAEDGTPTRARSWSRRVYEAFA